MEKRVPLFQLLKAAPEKGGFVDTVAADSEGEPELLRRAREDRGAPGAVARVCDGLLLGNMQAARDRELLRRSGVRAVCAVGCRQVFNDDLVYHRIPVRDDGSQSMLPYLDFACDFIHQQRASGTVLVHCQGGISRSPTLVIAYLMKHEQLSLAHAAEACCLARKAASPRAVFLRDLQQFAATLREEPQPAPDTLRWEEAARMASVETVAALWGRPVSCWREAQDECRRLLTELQDACVLGAFGERREPTPLLQEAARRAVSQHARAQGWTKLRPQQPGARGGYEPPPSE